jgi:RHS repeat-associated protein
MHPTSPACPIASVGEFARARVAGCFQTTRLLNAEHYNYFRDYDPSIGRYVESDPIGLKAGPNTYMYVGAAPLLQTDQFGLANGPGVAMAWKPKPEMSCEAPNDCPNAFTISYRGVCSAGDPMCGLAMQAAGITGPYYPQKITYSLNCVLKFGFGVKATESAAVSYGLSRAAAAGIPGAGGAAAFANNPGGMAIGAAYGLDWVVKRCECHGGAYD